MPTVMKSASLSAVAFTFPSIENSNCFFMTSLFYNLQIMKFKDLMRIKADSPTEYLSVVPDERRDGLTNLREVILANLPSGFKETMSYGMIGYVVPHSVYPQGYHCTPALPLPFLSFASKKNFVALYHMGIYDSPDLMKWFTDEWAKRDLGKLDMGKSCIRFKKPDLMPFDLIGELVSKMGSQDWIDLYESNLKR